MQLSDAQRKEIRSSLKEALRRQAAAIRKEHADEMRRQEELPVEQRPMDASYWMDRLNEAQRLEDAANDSE